ncbi:MAG TPA: DnaB-like helicase C-terminal domain-containing protein [Phycisphaerae bacterium]|nr:DnaB-like helicase C-terminal domain-containing protein [Phycisphaerae bacterium]
MTLVDQMPPCDEDAERALIAAVLRDPERVILEAGEAGLVSDDIYAWPNRILWDTVVRLCSAGVVPDVLTLIRELKRTGDYDKVGGSDYIQRLGDLSWSTALIGRHIEAIRACGDLRRILQASQELRASVRDPAADPATILAEHTAAMLALQRDGRGQKTNREVCEQVAAHWIAADEGTVTSLPSPWPTFDRLLGGPRDGLITVIAGYRGTGKSTLISNWARFLARRGVPVAVFPLEDGCDRFLARCAGEAGGFSTFKADTGRMGGRHELDRAIAMLHETGKLPLHLDDDPPTVEQLALKAMQMKARHGIKILFLDAWKDLVLPTEKSRSITEIENGMSGALCQLARRLHIPLVVAHHVKKVEKHVIGLNDVRGTGRIVDDARQVVILQHDRVRDTFALDVAKNSFGPEGDVPMERRANVQLFTEESRGVDAGYEPLYAD